MDLTFQVPMPYWSLQHGTLLLSPVTSTAGYYFCFVSIPSFFLESFLHWSPVAYWAPTDLGSSPFSVLFFFSFLLFHTVHGVLKARILKWVACHSLLQWTHSVKFRLKLKKVGKTARPFRYDSIKSLMIIQWNWEINPERMKRWSQSKNNTQLWMWLVIEARSNSVKSNIA